MASSLPVRATPGRASCDLQRPPGETVTARPASASALLLSFTHSGSHRLTLQRKLGPYAPGALKRALPVLFCGREGTSYSAVRFYQVTAVRAEYDVRPRK